MRYFSTQRGFTLIEVMVVIMIIGVLSGIVGMNVSGSQKRSKNAKMIAEVKQVQTGFELYFSDHGSYSNGCDDMRGDEYFPQGTPNLDVYNCSSDEYCVCGHLTEVGGELRGANSDSLCDFGAPIKEYFCVENAQ